MTARLILPADADRDEWLAARRAGVTASEIAVILGISPFDSPFNLYWRKRGDLPEDYDNTAMSLGRHLEPWIADQWAADHPEWIVTMGALMGSSERPWQLATTDRHLHSAGIGMSRLTLRNVLPTSILEIKSAGSYDGWGEEGTDQIPAYYRAQVLWQLDTLGLETAHVTCFFLGTRSRRDYIVSRDDDDLELMRKAALEFLAALEAGTPPDVDDHRATLGALRALHPDLTGETAQVRSVLAGSYRAACGELKRAKKQKARIENELRAAMGDAYKAIDPDGATVATRSIYTVAEHSRPASTVDKLTPPRSSK